jgi:glycerophosphoryl diester phosphodiesterase
MPAYDAAYHWGAEAMEISTSSTSDGVLICMHDLSYDRTTTITGVIHDLPSSVLTTARVRQPQLGPYWTTPPLPKIPLLKDVLSRFGGRMVLCVEAKRDADYPAVAAMVERHGLHDSVVMKLFHTSSQIDAAKRADYPVFVYLASNDVSAASIAATAARLDPARDYLVIPTSSANGQEYLPDSLVHAAVGTGVPTWVYPVHRRSEADHYRDLGVVGTVSSSVGYSSNTAQRVSSDDWTSGKVSSGEMTLDPSATAYEPRWHDGGVIALAAQNIQHFLTLGQFCPVPAAAASYRIEFDACWTMFPGDRRTNISLVFGQTDDRYYQSQLGHSDGYDAVITVQGALQLFRHVAGSTDPIALGAPASTSEPQLGSWMSFRLDVSTTELRWARTDAAGVGAVSAEDSHVRGGYLHIGRTSTDGAVGFRNFRVS